MKLERIADYYVRFTIIVAVYLVLNLLYLAYGRFEIFLLGLMYLIAIIVSGTSKAITSIQHYRKINKGKLKQKVNQASEA